MSRFLDAAVRSVSRTDGGFRRLCSKPPLVTDADLVIEEFGEAIHRNVDELVDGRRDCSAERLEDTGYRSHQKNETDERVFGR
jgi:hypothetical protein